MSSGLAVCFLKTNNIPSTVLHQTKSLLRGREVDNPNSLNKRTKHNKKWEEDRVNGEGGGENNGRWEVDHKIQYFRTPLTTHWSPLLSWYSSPAFSSHSPSAPAPTQTFPMCCGCVPTPSTWSSTAFPPSLPLSCLDCSPLSPSVGSPPQALKFWRHWDWIR